MLRRIGVGNSKGCQRNKVPDVNVDDEVKVDHGDAEISAATALAAKCDAICTNLARVLRSPVEYNKEGEFVEFRMVTARPK